MLVGPVYLVENALGDWRSVHLYPSHRRIDVTGVRVTGPGLGLRLSWSPLLVFLAPSTLADDLTHYSVYRRLAT